MASEASAVELIASHRVAQQQQQRTNDGVQLRADTAPPQAAVTTLGAAYTARVHHHQRRADAAAAAASGDESRNVVSSPVHRYFALHVGAVFIGFAVSRAAYLWYLQWRQRHAEPRPQQQRRRARPRSSSTTNAANVNVEEEPEVRPTMRPTPTTAPSPSRSRRHPADGGPSAAPVPFGGSGSDPTVVESPSITSVQREGRWVRVRPLGRGSFGAVGLVRNTDTGVYAAVKEVPVSASAQVAREFGVLCNLPPHPNVVRVFGADVAGNRARLFMEYCPNGTLADVLRARVPQPETFVRTTVRQILAGLAFLHQHNILHRDIKPANILVDASGVLKIADFGLSRHLDTLNTMTGQAGSPAYMSPEAVRGQLSSGSDLWAVGATMSEMLTGRLPWAHTDAFRAGREPLLLHIGTSEDDHPEIPSSASAEAKDLLRLLFRPDRRTRGSAAVALLHPFLRHGASSSSHRGSPVGGHARSLSDVGEAAAKRALSAPSEATAAAFPAMRLRRSRSDLSASGSRPSAADDGGVVMMMGRPRSNSDAHHGGRPVVGPELTLEVHSPLGVKTPKKKKDRRKQHSGTSSPVRRRPIEATNREDPGAVGEGVVDPFDPTDRRQRRLESRESTTMFLNSSSAIQQEDDEGQGTRETVEGDDDGPSSHHTATATVSTTATATTALGGGPAPESAGGGAPRWCDLQPTDAADVPEPPVYAAAGAGQDTLATDSGWDYSTATGETF